MNKLLHCWNDISFLKLFAIVTCVVYAQCSFADVYFLPRDINDLPYDTVESKMLHVSQAHVAYFDRFALERDFPFLKDKSNDAIEQWILDNCSYISEFQLRLDGIRQTSIPANRNNEKFGYRPPGWYRSAVVPVTDGQSDELVGLIDVKGAGFADIGLASNEVALQINLYEAANNDQGLLDELREKENSDGLTSFEEAIAEVVKTLALQKIFDTHRENKDSFFETVETYFVILLPFDILKSGTAKEHAALIGRQAHLGRYTNPFKIRNKFYIDPLGGKQFDEFGSAVDMGCVFPTAKGFCEKFLTKEQIIAFRTGNHCKELFDPKESIEWKKAQQAASLFLSGNDNAIYQHVFEMVGDRIERTAHERFSFRLDFNNAFFEYDDVPKLLALQHDGKINFYVQLLQSSDSSWIRAAATTLQHAKLNHPEIGRALVDRLGNKKYIDIAHDIAFALININPREFYILDSLADLLTHPCKSIRERAASVFASMPSIDAFIHPKLAHALKNDDPYVRIDVLKALGQNQPNEAIQFEMAARINDPVYSVQLSAIEALVKAAPTNALVLQAIEANVKRACLEQTFEEFLTNAWH